MTLGRNLNLSLLRLIISPLSSPLSSNFNHPIHTISEFYTTESESRECHLPPPPSRTIPLAGTVPYHTSYLFLHTNEPPESWPNKLDFPLYRQLKDKLAKYNGLVNICWSPNTTLSLKTGADSDSCSGSGLGLDPRSEEVYPGGTLWIRKTTEDVQAICKGVTLPVVTPDIIISIFDEIHLGRGMDTTKLASEDGDGNNDDRGSGGVPAPAPAFCSLKRRTAEQQFMQSDSPNGLYFYICCHRQRDCRCGIRGGDLADALTSELTKRNMLFDELGRPRLGRVGHVGGHRNAPNLIVFPHGDWFGNLRAEDLPSMVNHYVQSLQTTPEPLPQPPSPKPPSLSLFSLCNVPNKLQWRGRMGMTKPTQQATLGNL